MSERSWRPAPASAASSRRRQFATSTEAGSPRLSNNVKTAEDFGSQGEYPSHPQLLDWLATEFVRSGWDVKHLQRLIVTSATYRQASAVRPELLAKDPENRLLGRMARLRLPAEFIRDQ